MTTPRIHPILPEQVLGASYDFGELGQTLVWCVGRQLSGSVSRSSHRTTLQSYLPPSRTATELYLIVRQP